MNMLYINWLGSLQVVLVINCPSFHQNATYAVICSLMLYLIHTGVIQASIVIHSYRNHSGVISVMPYGLAIITQHCSTSILSL